MEFWNNIVNTSLLGTEKRQLTAADLPPVFEPVLNELQLSTKDPEEKFLSMVAVVSNYRQAGSLPADVTSLTLSESPAEEKKYCSDKSMRSLRAVLSEENNSLLSYWLRWCLDCGQVVQPELIPELLNIAVQQKTFRNAIVTVCGRRGEWLNQFHEAWNFSRQTNPEEIWQTGKPEERKELLRTLQKTNPQQAKEFLRSTWNDEPAGLKVDFLREFSPEVFANDFEWLESLLQEKSQKVKEQVLNMLKRIPSSAIVQLYWKQVSKAVTLKSGKALLGLINKTSLEINPAVSFDDSIFKTGIDKLSNNKQFTDEEFILFQLISNVPPKKWEQHFTESPQKIVDIFRKSQEKFFPAIVNAVKSFRDTTWAKVLVDQLNGTDDLELLFYMNAEERRDYYLKYHPKFLINYFQSTPETMNEWSRDFTKKMYGILLSETYNKAYFLNTIAFVPVEFQSELDSLIPDDPLKKTYWENTSEEIKRLLTIKQQIIQSFTL